MVRTLPDASTLVLIYRLNSLYQVCIDSIRSTKFGIYVAELPQCSLRLTMSALVPTEGGL